jgi:uncharacterized membrane protein
MYVILLGLLFFFSAHSLPMFPAARAAVIGRLGENGHKGLHSLFAATGIGLLFWGFSLARWEGAPVLWEMPSGLRWVTVGLTLPAYPLIFTVVLPGRIRFLVPHPMLTGVTLWAFAHLFIVGSSPAVAIFASFLVWGLLDRRSLLVRRPPAPIAEAPAFGRNDLLAVVIGLSVWGVTVFQLHEWLIGLSPLG